MLDVAIQAVSLVQTRELNHHVFKVLCEEFGSEHIVLLLTQKCTGYQEKKFIYRDFEL
jgi:hypothetical protein